MDAMSVLRFQYTQACARLDQRLAGLTEEEFFWEPVPGAWTLHRRSDDRGVTADGSGEWVLDYVLPEPHPAPLTTIAWRVVHIASVDVLYWDYAFGPATASFDLEFPGSASDALAWLTSSQHQVVAAIDGVSDPHEERRTNWGEMWPTWRIVSTLVDEQVHHGAEISLLRDLYPHRSRVGSTRG
jgi:hypothetical protein